MGKEAIMNTEIRLYIQVIGYLTNEQEQASKPISQADIFTTGIISRIASKDKET